MALKIWNPEDTLDSNNPDLLGCPFISGLDQTLNPLNLIYHPCIKELCHLWDLESQECSFNVKMRTLKHFHQQHEHFKTHSCISGLLMDCGESIGGHQSNVLKAPLLISEFMKNEDLDGNGLIYCKDFKIDPLDPNIPPILELEQQKSSCAGSILLMTWLEYLNSF